MKGLVVKSTGSWYTVKDEKRIIQCRIKGKFRLKGIRTTNPLTVGDRVEYELVEEDGTGIITKLEKRKNYIIRKATRFHKESHLIATNIDQAFLMVSLKSPVTPFEFIDRFLLAAESFFIDTKLLINKIDLIDDKTLKDFISIYDRAGYECIPISVSEKKLATVRKEIEGKINLIAGISGVGKSSLINYLNPEIGQKIKEISEYHDTGKHTTTFSELFEVSHETYLIDTPGIRSFGLMDIDKNEIGLFFKEIFHASKHCKFSNCTHMHEPGCSVVEAVREGKIAESRYQSYVSIYLHDDSKYR